MNVYSFFKWQDGKISLKDINNNKETWAGLKVQLEGRKEDG